MARVTYVGRYDEVTIPDLGVSVTRGEPIDVPDELAGRPPKGDDPGAGLLAQPDNWQPARGRDKTEE